MQRAALVSRLSCVVHALWTETLAVLMLPLACNLTQLNVQQQHLLQ